MKQQLRHSRLITVAAAFGIIVLVAIFGALGQAPKEQASPRVDTVSANDFDTTVKNIEKSLEANHMMVVAKIDHQNMLSMVGTKIKGSKTIEFGNPDMGKMVFASDAAAGLEMPAKLYIFERADGKTVVSYYKPSAGFAAYKKPELTKVGEMMDMAMNQIVAEATK